MSAAAEAEALDLIRGLPWNSSGREWGPWKEHRLQVRYQTEVSGQAVLKLVSKLNDQFEGKFGRWDFQLPSESGATAEKAASSKAPSAGQGALGAGEKAPGTVAAQCRDGLGGLLPSAG